jgi:hypothetical protein
LGLFGIQAESLIIKTAGSEEMAVGVMLTKLAEKHGTTTTACNTELKYYV